MIMLYVIEDRVFRNRTFQDSLNFLLNKKGLLLKSYYLDDLTLENYNGAPHNMLARDPLEASLSILSFASIPA